MKDDTYTLNTIEVQQMAESGVTLIPDFQAIELAVLGGESNE